MTTDSALRSAHSSASYRIGMISTYPPKLCGLATFASALENALRRAGNCVEIVEIQDSARSTSLPDRHRQVVGQLVNGSPDSVRRAASTLSKYDVAIVQHEFGIFGGPDGSEVLALAADVRVPMIVVLHTVPLDPTANQRFVLESLGHRADRLVVMTEAAKARLLALFDVSPDKVATIAHGAMVPTDTQRHLDDRPGERARLLTWGLLGPGKGIEHVIDSFALLQDILPSLLYTVAGVTHPKVFERDGERYRRSLAQRAAHRGVSSSVVFDETYRDVASLTRFVAAADVVILPYDSHDQVTSGVLVDAIAAGRPVIATAFPHAVEMLRSGAGIVVPHGDPWALAAAIRTLLTEPGQLRRATREAQRIAPSLSWSSIAQHYLTIVDDVLSTMAAVAS